MWGFMVKEEKDLVFNKGFAIGVVIGSLVTGFFIMNSLNKRTIYYSDRYRYLNECSSEKVKNYGGYEKSLEMRDAIDFVDEHFSCSKTFEEKLSLAKDTGFREKMKEVRVRYKNYDNEEFGSKDPILVYKNTANEFASIQLFPEKLANNLMEK